MRLDTNDVDVKHEVAEYNDYHKNIDKQMVWLRGFIAGIVTNKDQAQDVNQTLNNITSMLYNASNHVNNIVIAYNILKKETDKAK